MAHSAQPYVVGGGAACLASAAIHPIDVAKVRLQLYATQNPGLAKPSFVGMLSDMVRTSGVRSIYVGLDASLMRQASYGTARIGLNRSFADKALSWYGGSSLPFYLKVASGMASGAVAVCLGTPMDLALVRLQADSMKPVSERRNYRGVVDALARISKEEGVFAMWKGVFPNILRGMAMNVGQLAIYDQAKETMTKVFGDADSKSPSMATKLACAAISGFTAAAFSLPFDLLKSRIQDQKPMANGAMPYAGVADCAAKVVRAEGTLALWTGFTAYYCRCAPHAMIILMTVEMLNPLYQRAFLRPSGALDLAPPEILAEKKRGGARVGLALSMNTSTNIFYADPDVAAQTEAAGTHDSKAAFRVRAGPEIAHAVEDANVAAVAFELLRMNSKPPEQESTTIAA